MVDRVRTLCKLFCCIAPEAFPDLTLTSLMKLKFMHPDAINLLPFCYRCNGNYDHEKS